MYKSSEEDLWDGKLDWHVVPSSPVFFFSSRRRHTRSLCDWSSDGSSDLDHFIALKREGCPDTATTEWERGFRGRFEMMALQRNLKALGTFGYQTTARSNPVYMQYIPRTLRYVSMALERQPQFGQLRELLAGVVGEIV